AAAGRRIAARDASVLLHTQVLQRVPSLLARRAGISNIGPRPFLLLGEPMRSVSRSVAIVSALLVVAASAASAQHPQTRKGFWIGFGFGYGSYTCTDCSSVGSVSGYLKMGGTV